MRIGGHTARQNHGLRGIRAMLDGLRDRGITRTAIGAVAFLACAAPVLQAASSLVLSADGITVYDTVNKVSWLADFNLPASNRFGLPVCNVSNVSPTDSKGCINASGSMSYQAATAWVDAMNSANYLGHNNWQLPTTPLVDNTGCTFVGANNGSFGFDCVAGALGWLYSNGLGLNAPNSAVPIAAYNIGPFSNFQPYYYWSQTPGDNANSSGYNTFSFNTGFQDTNTKPNYMYVLPMIPGKIPGTPAALGSQLQTNPGGQTVYDPMTNVTFLANANLAATNTFGIPACKDHSDPKPCVGADGAMDWDSASQFIANMNADAYLGQTNWQLPPVDPNCPSYGCGGSINPMGNLYYDQLGFFQGTPVVVAPNIAVGPFNNVQPYIYWSCQAPTIQSPCQPLTNGPATGFEWCFSFGNGFLGTDVFGDDYYVTAYFIGQSTSTTGPEIAEVANAEGESPTIAPNTWVEIKGVDLAPAGDSRIWQGSDFAGTQMPTSLDHVSATVNGVSAYVYYISPTQVNVLTPPNALPTGPVKVVVTNNGAATASFTAQVQSISPSFFVFGGGPYVAARHSADYSLSGAPSLSSPGYPFTPAAPSETIVLYANGFGTTSTSVVSGSTSQGGTLATLPVVQIGGVTAKVEFAGLVSPGEFQFNVTVPASLANGDQPITATYGGASTQPGTLITIHN
jgi:uncharacterized protein (TIGR03437 family)